MFPIPFNFPFRKKDGSLTSIGAAIDAGGGGEPYILPTANGNTKGGVKIGSRLTMDGEVLNADAQIPAYSIELAGKVLKVADDGSLEWDDGGGSGGVVVISGINEPTSSLGEDGNIYFVYMPAQTLKTNGHALDLILTNYIYRTSDKLVYRFKNSSIQTSSWPYLFTVDAITNNIASVGYNLFNARKAINVRHGGAFSGDGNYPTDAVIDLTSYFEITLDGSNVAMKSGPTFGAYDTSEFTATLGTSDDTDTTNVTLLPSNSNNPQYFDFHELLVYRNDVLIHDYKPITGAIKDFIDNTTFNISTSGVIIQDAGEITNAYFKKNGIWQLLIGSNINDFN